MTKYPGKAEDHSESDGVRPMNLSGRLVHDKERLYGMTDQERAWRRQWLKDQNLTPREPVQIDRYNPELLNPIRRAYRWPLNFLFYKGLQPVIGEVPAFVGRVYTGKILMGLWVIFGTFYYFKYSTNNWEKTGSWRVIMNRKAVYPGEEEYPATQQKTKGSEYDDRGFSTSVLGSKNAASKEECAPKEPRFKF